MAPEFFAIRTFFVGFVLGIGLFILFYNIVGSDFFNSNEEISVVDTINFQHSTVGEIRMKEYDAWFNESGLKKQYVDIDVLRYTNAKREVESEYLFKKVSILCAVYTSNPKYAKAIKETWATSCNEVVYYSRHPEKESGLKINNRYNTSSSFHLLCDVIGRVVDDYPTVQWGVFVKDDIFVIPENIRHLVAPLNPDDGHYLGHAINFWGVEYNMALSGFVLSRGAMRKFRDKFPNSTSCSGGGKYWKQEDLYLGKHLSRMGIQPVDTRDRHNYTSFLAYDLDKMMFPGSMLRFTTYSTRALYPVKCCGSYTITFPVLSSTEMYTYYYMIYTMGIFISGNHGNKPPPFTIPDYQVWQEFLQNEGHPLNVTNVQYEEIWFKKIGNKNIVRPDKPYFSPQQMPGVFESILYNFTSKKAL